MSSILREALAGFASCASLHGCAKKQLKDLQRERQGWDLPALLVAKTHCIAVGASLQSPRTISWGQIVCNVSTTGTYMYLYSSLFC